MQIVHAAHAVDLLDVGHHRFHVDVAGCAFQQNLYTLADDKPGIPHNEQADQYTDQGIEDRPARQHDQRTRDQRTQRRERIARQMNESTALIQVNIAARSHQQRRAQVDDEGQRGNGAHQSSFHLRRIEQTLIGLIEDAQRDQHQRGRIEQCDQNSGAMIAERSA